MYFSFGDWVWLLVWPLKHCCGVFSERRLPRTPYHSKFSLLSIVHFVMLLKHADDGFASEFWSFMNFMEIRVWLLLQACSGAGFDYIIFPKKISSHWAMAYVHSSGLPPLGGLNCHR